MALTLVKSHPRTFETPPPPPTLPIPDVGQSFFPYGPGGSASVGATLDSLIAGSMIFSRNLSVDQFTLEVTAAGTVGAVVRVGLYADNGAGKPGALIADNGTVDATVAAEKPLAVAWDFVADTVYWIAVVSQIAACSLRLTGVDMSPTIPVNRVGMTLANNATGYQMGGVPGALPAIYAESAVSRPAKVLLKRSA